MPEPAPARRAFVATTGLLIAASAALAGAALPGWAQVDVQVPLRGTVPVRVAGSAVLPALVPLALLALAAVAAVLATRRWARWLLGVLLLVAAVPPAIAAQRVTDGRWLTGVAMSAASLPVRSVPTGTVTVLFLGPALAVGGAALLAVAGIVLMVWGHRMPRLGRRYQVPAAPPDGPGGRFWERMDAGEDPTAPGPPVTGYRAGRS